MCGIAGIYNFSGAPFSAQRLLDMAEAIIHRGPDGEGASFFQSDGSVQYFNRLDRQAASAVNPVVGLAHRRLAIIDLTDSGAQPMVDSTGRYWITYNGELYNYVELRDELRVLGHQFKSTSDTEVILNAFRTWGIECLNRFNGMFAFAIYDCQERRIFCARDRLGIKPFYFSIRSKKMYFASEQKAILAALDGKPRPNVSAIADYLSFSYIPSTQTMFEGIRRLAPGEYMIVDAEGLKIDTYWDPVFQPAPGQFSVDDCVDELRSLLQDSARMQVRSDVPVGAHLSGGIDSSAVCSLAAGHVSQLKTFTAKFAEGGFFDESKYARLVANKIGSDHHEVVPTATQFLDLLPKVIYHLDEPVEAASVFGKYKVAEIVSKSVKVVLGGQGGDELFGGYDFYHKAIFTASFYGADLPTLNKSKLNFLIESLKGESVKRLAKSIARNYGQSNLDEVFCKNWNRFPRSHMSQLFNSSVVNEHDLDSRERFLKEFSSLRAPRDGDRMFKFDMRHYLQALLTSEDRLSMAFSVESRVPLLDHRIAELAARVGHEYKAIPGNSKYLLRRALDGIIPQEILDRKDKRGFPTPIAAWLNDENLGLVNHFILNDNDFAKRYFDLDEIKRMQKTTSRVSTDPSERLWRVLGVCVWGQVFDLS